MCLMFLEDKLNATLKELRTHIDQFTVLQIVPDIIDVNPIRIRRYVCD